MFERLVWKHDRMFLNDLVFRLEHTKSETWDLGEQCFALYKTEALISQYARFWSSKKDFHPGNMLELGVWDGGSIAFWHEYFQPRMHAGVDIATRGDSKYFANYLQARGLDQRIKTFWGVDQADSQRLRDIVQQVFNGPLDLVIDDASHKYRLTKSSFETLFPLLRPGGLYIIEDWAWAHWPDFQTPNSASASATEPSRLIIELIEAAGSSTRLIASVTVFQGFAVVERADASLAELDGFHLDEHISRRAHVSGLRATWNRVRAVLMRSR